MTDDEYWNNIERQHRIKDQTRKRYSESREHWHNNVSPHVEMSDWPEWKRRQCADKLGPKGKNNRHVKMVKKG